MSRDDLRSIQSVPKAAYSDLPLSDLAAYGMSLVLEMNERLTIENICVALHRLFAEKFALVGFPEHPDGMRVNRTLLQMQPRYRNYATGSAKKGFVLTTLGWAAASSVKRHIELAQAAPSGRTAYRRTPPKPRDTKRTLSDEDIIRGVRDSDLFRLYLSGDFESARGLEFLALLNAFAHTPKKEISRRLTDIEVAAKNVKDTDVSAFLNECRRKYASLLKR
jgi:hypothetical protein